ncbi:tRNA pseudouridine(55) synthase TruB [Metamycoplasma hominis]|uniref:tRNA pseudouridine(55) synthase TruB n=1 Tax=Metamycoplasma hominis TaxID=2098 RepID=UPI001593F837|nr:tRNA pseudouridine(55) synthase TruB [Metamycoplasma hominis]QKX37743.1 tRNA pseudouridine(55) synthase TruB [Metamycoplasma hominis]UIU37981.1 tRNA pseudouridine(55) synthase TruB [Metamycoplasma hominis]
MFYKLYKKRGQSSFFAIKKFAKNNNINKIGHCGTLDPEAEGLLIVATDEDTKALSLIENQSKEYYVEAKFHYSSDSFDLGTYVTKIQNFQIITKSQIIQALEILKKQTKQVPPIYSAKKINGTRAYKLARDNKEFSLKANDIKINNLELIEFNKVNQSIIIKANVSKGTYIRSLIHDLANICNTDAVVVVLKRIKIGNICLNGQEEFEKITNLNELFNVKLFKLTKNDIQILANQNSNSCYFESLKNFCGNIIFIYLNNIVGWGKSEFGNVTIFKRFFKRLTMLISS